MKTIDKTGLKRMIYHIIERSYKPSLVDIMDQLGFGDDNIFDCLNEMINSGNVKRNTQGINTYYTLN